MKKTAINNALHIARQRKADGGKTSYLFEDPLGYFAKKGQQVVELPINIANMASAVWEHPVTQEIRKDPAYFAYELGKEGAQYAYERPFSAVRKAVDFATDWSADPRVVLAKQLFSSTPANVGEDEFARQVQYGIRPAPEAEPPQYADGGIVRDEYAGGGDVVLKALSAFRGAQKVFPKPQRMFPEGAQPPGGEYLNAVTGEAITGQKPARAVIGVTPEGKPVFLADAEQVDVTGSPGPGSTKTKTNLFKQKAGWKWTEAPEGYENVPTIVSAENRGQHYYGLGADFPKGVDLERYADAPSEPRLRPTTQGNVYPGEQVGSISVRGREHPVYDMLTIRNLLAGTGAGAAGAAAMQEAEPSQYAKGGMAYPLDDKSNWNENADYQETGGRMTHMSPDAFLDKVAPLDMDKKDKKSIKKFKKQIKLGKKSDPAAIYPKGGQDGRHHAAAAKQLAVKKMPVITWDKKAGGGSITDNALMLLSKKAKSLRGRP